MLKPIDLMINEVSTSSDLYKPQKIWDVFLNSDIQALNQHGLDNFKKTLNSHYSQHVVVSEDSLEFKLALAAIQKYHNQEINPSWLSAPIIQDSKSFET
jgi:hypothetical protein